LRSNAKKAIRSRSGLHAQLILTTITNSHRTHEVNFWCAFGALLVRFWRDFFLSRHHAGLRVLPDTKCVYPKRAHLKTQASFLRRTSLRARALLRLRCRSLPSAILRFLTILDRSGAQRARTSVHAERPFTRASRTVDNALTVTASYVMPSAALDVSSTFFGHKQGSSSLSPKGSELFLESLIGCPSHPNVP
jgi:hypothetical protein